MQPSAILEAALYVSDLVEAERFYGETLGLERIARVGGLVVFIFVPRHDRFLSV